MTRPATLTLHEAREAIESGQVRLLTSDVFDTLVWRPVAEPHHLFLLLARRCRAEGWLHGWVDDRTFAIGRTRAEHEARRAVMATTGSPECTLEEIWDHMSTAFWAVPVALGAAIELELEVELAHLRRHPGASGLIADARHRDIDVVLVSDSYYSVDQLRRLLVGAGLELDDVEIVTSSSRRMNKWDGLLADIVASRADAGRVLHIGDNSQADVEVANRIGVASCHVDLHENDDAVGGAHESWTRLSNAVGSDGGRSAAVRETLVNAHEHGRDPGYQFGAAVAGPIMAGFAGWVSATADELGAGAIHCLLREGARIAELIDVVRPEGPHRVLVHASRWAIMRAAVIDGTADELELALARRLDLRAAHVTDAFGCDTARVASVIGGQAVPRARRSDAYEALSNDDALRAQIVESAAEQRTNVLAYLDRTLQLDDGPLVLADIGWGGTIQAGITGILRTAGIEPEVVGLYALLSPPGEHRTGSGARLLGYLPTVGADGASTPHAHAAIRHPEFLERINTPAIGTLLEFDRDGTPVTRPDDHDVISDSLRLAEAGVTDFCTTLSTLLDDDAVLRGQWFGDGRFASAALELLATVIQSPDPRVAAALGAWHHDDVAGTAAEALSDETFGRWVPYANAVDAAEITMHDVYWVPGVASVARSALAEQLQALARGAHPDTLCPPSATGLARIAVFPPGSDLAAAQTEAVPRLGTAGRMLVQLRSPVAGLRSVRFDLGDTDHLVDVGDAEIRLETDDGDVTIVDGVAQLVSAGTWIGGRWLGGGQAVARRGGHLLVDVPGDLADRVRGVAVSIGARTWRIDDAAAEALLPRWRTAIEPARRRLASRLGRR